jgi:hypothetical protein
MEHQSRLAIPLDWRNLSRDEDLVAVRWGDCRVRVRATYGRKPFSRRDINGVLPAHDR